MRTKLSPRVIDAAKPQDKPYEIPDADVRGLLLRVQPSGVKSFIVTWGRGKRRTLGRYPIMTVTGARQAAMAALTEAAQHGAPLAVLEARKTGPGGPLTLRRFVEGDYRAWAAHELKRGEEAVNRILSVFARIADKPLDAIDRKMVEGIITARRRDQVSAATTNRDLAAIKAALTKAVEWELIPAHPLDRLRPSRIATGGVVRYLTAEEGASLRTALKERESERRTSRERHNAWHEARGTAGHPQWPDDGYTDHLMPMVLLALNTGLRRGELFGLRWRDVNLQTRLLTVAAESAKSGKARHIPLNAEAHDVLTRWRAQQSGTGLVFANSSGGRFDNIQTSWERLTAAAKIQDFRFHDLRHDFASKLVMAGVDLNTVRELLGHGDIKMTLRYAHLAPAKLAEAVSRL